MPVEVDIVAGNLPPNFCYQNPQQLLNAFVAAMSASIAGNFAGVIIQNGLPSVADQGKLWIRIDTSNRPIGTFIYQGQWIWPHPDAPSSKMGRIWFDTEAALWAYEGGSGIDPTIDVPTATTGSFWKRNTDMNHRFPLAIGTMPSGLVIAPGDTGGEENHVLTVAELAIHKHTVTFPGAAAAAGGYQIGGNFNGPATFDTSNTGSDTPHNTMPPYRGIIWAVRTARAYFVAS